MYILYKFVLYFLYTALLAENKDIVLYCIVYRVGIHRV